MLLENAMFFFVIFRLFSHKTYGIYNFRTLVLFMVKIAVVRLPSRPGPLSAVGMRAANTPKGVPLPAPEPDGAAVWRRLV